MSTLYTRDTEAIALNEKLRFFPLAVERGEGATLVEEGGRELIDLSAGWGAASVGYSASKVVDAVRDAVHTMPGASVLSGTHQYVVDLAERLLEITPLANKDNCVYVGLAGSDANSAALEGIRTSSDRSKILAFENSYHGGSGSAQSVSGIAVAGGFPQDPDLVLVPYPDIGKVEKALAGRDVSAVFVEPILSDGGLIIPPRGFLTQLRDLCTEYGTLLVVDEVKVGMGRTGRMFTFEHDEIRPDIVTLGKALGGGLPLSAAVGPRSVLGNAAASSLLTLAGNPVSAAAGIAVLDTLREEQLPDRAARLGTHLEQLLATLARRHTIVSDVRNRGLVGGIELRADSSTPATTQTAKIVYRAWQLGAVAYYVGQHGNVIELTPPLVIDEEQLAAGIAIISQAISDVTSGLVADDVIKDFAGW